MDTPTPVDHNRLKRKPCNLTDEARRKGLETRARNQKLRAEGKLIHFQGRRVASAQREASAELLPKILGDEIAWRSSILDMIGEMRGVLMDDIRSRTYDPKATAPALVREIRGLLELELKVIEKAKGLPFLKDAQAKQVTMLYQRHELLRKQLTARGLMDEHGRLIDRTASAQAVEEAPASPPADPAPKPEGVS